MSIEGNLWEPECVEVLSSALRSLEDLRAKISDKENRLNHTEKKLGDIVDKLKQLSEESRKSKDQSPHEAGSSSGKHAPVRKDTSAAYPDLPPSLRKILLTSPVIQKFRLSYDNLPSAQLKLCLLCFAIFPVNAIVKKRTLIYWWIGEGLIFSNGGKTAEEVGEEVFQELVKQGLIKQVGNDSSPILNRCRIYPWMQYMLISLAQDAHFSSSGEESPIRPSFMLSSNQMHLISGGRDTSGEHKPVGDSVSTIYNLSGQYLNLTPQWFSNCKKLRVFQLGRWQHSPRHHIEVESEKFLEGLGKHKYLKFLSLRGISRITVLPDSIVQLITLEILDLRACHNLEKLPEDIASLRKLTHLDVSECYLIEHMPKGIEKLSSLQVLKGFVLGTMKKNPCRINDLSKLTKLRRLSIYIGTGAVIKDEFSVLIKFKCLKILTISWGIARSSPQDQPMGEAMTSWQFPKDMEKLHLIGMPVVSMPECLSPSKLGALKKLYITGGKLASLNGLQGKWDVQLLRLHHLKDLEEIEVNALLKNFPQLSYFERVRSDYDNSKWHRDTEIEVQ